MIQAFVDTIDAALEGRARPPHAPVPWLTWLTVCLMRQRARQAWHRQIVNGPLVAVDDDQGAVPGLAGWTFARHGIGCTLIGPDGETIDVDERDRAAAIIDPWFFAWRLRTVCTVALPERRAWRWLMSEGMAVHALGALRVAGVITYPDGDHLFRLVAPLDVRVARLGRETFDEARWMAALGDGEADAIRAAHQAWLVAMTDDRRTAGRALEVLATVVSTSTLVALAERVMAGPIDAASGAAVRVLRAHPKGPITDAVATLLGRLDPAVDLPYPATEVIGYLLERAPSTPGLETQFDAHAATDRAPGFTGHPFLGDYALLALVHRPARALALVRRALRGAVPASVGTLAAALHALDQPWCRRELAMVPSALANLDGYALEPDAPIVQALRRQLPADGSGPPA